MGIIAWIVLGAIAGFITNLLMGGKEGPIFLGPMAGLAGLADPRSERFLTWRPDAPWSAWSGWTPRPAGEIAPVDGFTVP